MKLYDTDLMIMLSFTPAAIQRYAVDMINSSEKDDSLYALAAGSPVPAHIAKTYGSTGSEASRAIMTRCEKQSYGIITFSSPHYPPLLREIYSPPLVLYTRGNIPAEPYLSIVGTRNSDRASDQAARRLAHETAQQNICIVSGMAVGIDRVAHMGALDARGATIGVLPNGIDINSPASNRDLYNSMELSEHCALISEYPPGVSSETWTFVRRNRIISGIAPVTAVMKAGIRSGAMITARCAIEQGRELFACGGFPYDDGYAGCQSLIRDGAQIISSTADILAEYAEKELTLFPLQKKSHNRTIPAFPEGSIEEKIISLLKDGPRNIDTIIREYAIQPSLFNKTVICLEIAGVVQRAGSLIMLSVELI
jgi:DNA processing protein